MSVERLGRFELVSHLASGGMAKVFLARVAGLAGFERHVVLKTLRKEDIPDESYVGMFLDEARLAASLHHQHVAQVYDVGCTSDGTYFLAMEYVHGKTVRSVLETVDDRRLWMPLDFGLSVVSAAAAGLHHAHERCRSDGTPLHIVHRDVSPSNVLVSYDGSIKLIDFGIAKATARVTQTRTGFIKGKAGYMAPEQARGYAVDRRSDVFSLGVLAYELTTQHRAFDAPTEFERVERIVHGDITPPSHWVPDYPPELESIIVTALALDPDDRYQSADEMRSAIEACAKSENLVLGGAPIARLLSMLYGAPLEPWIAPPANVAKGSGSHDSLVFVPDIPHAVDESADITKPIDRELTEAEAIVDELAERHAVNARHIASREAALAERDAANTMPIRNQLPRAGTIRPAQRTPISEPSAPQIVISQEPSSAPRDPLSARAASPDSAASRSSSEASRSQTESISSRSQAESTSSRSQTESASPRSLMEPSSSPRKASPSQPPPIPSVSRSMPAASPPAAISRSMPTSPGASISRSMPATLPPPLPSRSMPAVSADEPPPFIAQPIASPTASTSASLASASPIAPLTLDDSAAVPLLIAVDTPSTPISNYAAAPPMVIPSVTIQPRNRKARPSTPPKSSLRRQVLAVIACGAVLGLAIGVTITVLGNDAPASTPASTATTASTGAASARTAPTASTIVAPTASTASTPTASPTTAASASTTPTASPTTSASPAPITSTTSAPTASVASAAAAQPTTPAPAKSAMATTPIAVPEVTAANPSPAAAASANEVTISVVTDPPGATVVLDGVRLGTTPYTGTVPAQKRDGWLKVRKRDHIAVKTKVDRATDIRWDVKLNAAKR